MNIIAQIRDTQNRITLLDKLIEKRKRALTAVRPGTEYREVILDAQMHPHDKNNIDADIARMETESAALKIRVAEMQKQVPPETKADRQELERVTDDADKAFDKFIKSLVVAEEAGRKFTEFRQQEAALRSRLDGTPDYWKLSQQGLITGYIIQEIGQLLRDVELMKAKK